MQNYAPDMEPGSGTYISPEDPNRHVSVPAAPATFIIPVLYAGVQYKSYGHDGINKKKTSLEHTHKS